MRPIAAALVLLAACTPAAPPREQCLVLPEQDSPIVARIGSTTLRLVDLERRIKEQGSAAQRYTDSAGLRRFVEDQVRLELLAQAAMERGLDRDPDVVDAARKVMVRKLLLQDLGSDSSSETVDEEAVRAYYAAHLDEYTQPERRRLAHIQYTPTPEGRALAQQTIDKLLACTRDDVTRTFGRYATQSSLDRDSRGRGGELAAFIGKDELVRDYGQSFADEAFKLGVGDFSLVPTQSTRGWHVLLIHAKRDPYARALEEVAAEVKDRLTTGGRSQRFQRYLQDLRQRYPVALFEKPLSELRTRSNDTTKKE